MTYVTQLYYDIFPIPGIIGGDKFNDADDEPELRGADAAPSPISLAMTNLMMPMMNLSRC